MAFPSVQVNNGPTSSSEILNAIGVSIQIPGRWIVDVNSRSIARKDRPERNQ